MTSEDPHDPPLIIGRELYQIPRSLGQRTSRPLQVRHGRAVAPPTTYLSPSERGSAPKGRGGMHRPTYGNSTSTLKKRKDVKSIRGNPQDCLAAQDSQAMLRELHNKQGIHEKQCSKGLCSPLQNIIKRHAVNEVGDKTHRHHHMTNECRHVAFTHKATASRNMRFSRNGLRPRLDTTSTSRMTMLRTPFLM